MSIISHQTVSDSPQANGTRNVEYEFTFSEGPIVRRGPKRVHASFDDAADRTSLITQIEQEEKLAEKYRAEQRALNGDDFSDIASSLLYNTTAEAAEFILKRMSNCVQIINKRTVQDDLPKLFLLKKIWTELTDNQIANFMGESVGDVATWRTSFNTMLNSINAYATPFGFYEDVEDL